MDALAKHASASGYRLARHLPPHLVPRCFTQLQHSWALGQSVHTHQPAGGGAEVVVPYNGVCPAVGNVSAALLSWAEAGGVACVPTICSFHLQASGDDFKYAGLRRGFKVSSLFEDEVAAVLDELERRYGTRQYIAVHARTEEDWADNCPKSELTWTRGWYCYVSDWNLTQVQLVGWLNWLVGWLVAGAHGPAHAVSKWRLCASCAAAHHELKAADGLCGAWGHMRLVRMRLHACT